MQDVQYITIQGWMRTKLDLKGNDLLIYAIIYGFSQVEGQKFTGSLQYLADWCGATKQGVQKNIKNLIEKNLIEKREYIKNGIKFCEYSCMVCNSVVRGMQLSCTNNIDNIIEEKSITSSNTRKPNMYDKCIAEINAITSDQEHINLLTAFLDHLIKSYKERGGGMYTNVFKGKLNTLKKFPESEWTAIINQTLENGWLGFYPLKTWQTKYSQPNDVNSIPYDADCRYVDENEKKLKEREKRGEQIKF